MDDILTQPATDVARMLRGRELSSRELTEAQLARIEAVNPGLNAVVELRGEQALAEAAAADEATARGGQLGPLHGLPMTVKESFDVAGLHTTWGNPAFADHVATADATVVRRLRQAGAVILGKTNVAFMLGDFGQTANELHGVTANPWDPARAPGGSSGGAAAAVAAGLTFLEYGSDLVGSIRIPASYCGVYGLKPSVGVVPLTGFQPPGPPAGPSEMRYLSAVGPLGRSAQDLRTALAVTAGPEEPAARAYAWSLARPRHTRLAGARVGVVLDHAHAPVSSEVGAVLSDAVDALARAGARIARAGPTGSTRSPRPSRSGSTCGCSSPTSSPAGTSPRWPRRSTTSAGGWLPGPPGPATSTTSTCSCARPPSAQPSRTTRGRSRPARSPPPKGTGPMPTRPSGWRTRPCPGCRR